LPAGERLRLARGMRIVPLDPADEDAARGCHEVRVAAQEADDPQVPPESLPVLRSWLTTGWGSHPGEAWTAVDDADGRVLGWYVIGLPDLENLGRATVIPVVHPAFRRRGVGRELLRHAAGRAAASGRSVLGSVALQDTAGQAFARQIGAKAGVVEARRLLDLTAAPPGTYPRLRAGAAGRAAGYTLARWLGATPDEYVVKIAGALNAMNDAPSNEGWEDHRWDTDRVRERHDGVVRLSTVRRYSVAARHEETGEVAALTQVYIDPGVRWLGQQGLTAVTRPHRGHRLGLLTKAAMLEWLAEAEPALERIITGNADSNSYMISVNETLGFELLEPAWQFYQLPASEAG
jgi:RimJ/RimL family protein N-acetyltransferase